MGDNQILNAVLLQMRNDTVVSTESGANTPCILSSSQGVIFKSSLPFKINYYIFIVLGIAQFYYYALFQ
jgi:hypothetical protein